MENLKENSIKVLTHILNEYIMNIESEVNEMVGNNLQGDDEMNSSEYIVRTILSLAEKCKDLEELKQELRKILDRKN